MKRLILYLFLVLCLVACEHTSPNDPPLPPDKDNPKSEGKTPSRKTDLYPFEDYQLPDIDAKPSVRSKKTENVNATDDTDQHEE